MDFLPESNLKQREIPYFEDASISGKGGNLHKSIEGYQSDLGKAITKLGGLLTGIAPGTFSGKPVRYGYRITFLIANMPGRIDIAALPIRSETQAKKENALKQALYLFWKELDAAGDSWVYNPNNMPLLPYLIGSGGKTVAEELIQKGTLPDVSVTAYLPERVR